jgi:Lon protease-like protein|tara:strand:+ start:229 stop:954 length:726 start_codon:yes stop_codon:yes gene_type:complete
MENLPLFVLPMVLLPGEVQELRVFEPRYKQMLDDCLLDGKNFGLVRSDFLSEVNHWDGPMEYGCEAEIIHHETKGSNHFLQIVGRRKFVVKKVHKPALPPFNHPSMSKFMEKEGIYPDLESLIAEIPEDIGTSKLYISADVEFIDVIEGMDTSQQFELEVIVRNILQRVAMILNVDDESFAEWIEKSPVMGLIDDKPESIFSVSALLFGDLDLRQEILETKDPQDVLALLSSELNKFGEEE